MHPDPMSAEAEQVPTSDDTYCVRCTRLQRSKMDRCPIQHCQLHGRELSCRAACRRLAIQRLAKTCALCLLSSWWYQCMVCSAI